MRIAEIAPVWFSVPPTGYGGIELVVALLADGLVDAGHDVPLFASGGSVTKAALVSPLDEPPDPALLGNVWFDAYHTLASFEHAGEFDVIHDHSGIIGPALGSMLGGRPPVVHTLHGPWTEPARRYYELVHERIHLVSISESQAAGYPDLRYAGTVYNGIDLDAYPFREERDKEGFLLYMGRANPDKGPALAIDVAAMAGMPLVMLVKKSEPFEQDYWEQEVAPKLTDAVEVRENIPHAEKADLLGRARAMVFPIQWPEPFGLVMIEAMACGTPVVTAPLGAAPELVAEGETGFLADTVEGMAAGVARVDEISSLACRKRVEERFSARAMVEGYLEIFERTLSA
ncbi:MAG: glycosyltransferase family 4 protein [Actinobacteria bacterium]|nr:glycosyltransferase family 4 protein [Actinomycetota bacterium]